MPRPFRRCAPALALIGFASMAASSAQASVVTSSRTLRPAFEVHEPLAVNFMVPAVTTYALKLVAGPGEANTITFELTENGIVVRDGAGITPGEGCTAVDAGTAECATPPEPGTERVERRVASASLGDGDDAIALPSQPPGSVLPEVDGGTGDDTITGAGTATGGDGNDRIDADVADGGAGDDRITAQRADGGDGNDILAPRAPDRSVTFRGGAGDDVLTGSDVTNGPTPGDVLDGGAGDDRLAGGGGDDKLPPGPGADVIDGGAGVDFVSFAGVSAPVHADLTATAPTDPTGEGDAMTGIESVEGGSGDDVLLGSDGASVLMAGDGDDRLEGRGGPDILIGGRGADLIDGGGGADDLTAGTATLALTRPERFGAKADDAIDRVAGGTGADEIHVDRGDHADGGAGNDLIATSGRPASARCGTGSRDRFDGFLLPRDCERIVWFGSRSAPARMTLRGRRLSIRVPASSGGRVTVTLCVGGRRVARGSGRIGIGASRLLRLPVARRDRRALRRARSVRVELLAPGPGSTSRRDRDVAVLPPPR